MLKANKLFYWPLWAEGGEIWTGQTLLQPISFKSGGLSGANYTNSAFLVLAWGISYILDWRVLA